MFKKLLQLKTLLVALLVMTGAGNVWADEVTYSLTPNQTNTGNTATNYITSLTDFTYNGISWIMNQWNPSTLQIKTNQGSAANEFRFYNTSGFAGRITKVVIKFSALAVKDASKLMFLGGTSEVTATTGGTAGTWNNNEKTLTWTPETSDNFTFFAFYQNGKAASGNNYLADSEAIVVTYETGTSSKTATTTEIDDSHLTNRDVYLGTNAGYFSAIVKAGENPIVGASVTWSSTDTIVAKIDPTTGYVTLVGEGTTTIKATYSGDEDYAASSADYSLDVTSSAPSPLWEETPLEDLTEDDVLVIVGHSSSDYAMSNNNGTTSAPTVVNVTIEDGEITSNVQNTIKWNVSGNDEEGYIFYPNGSTESWLYCTNTNNGVRVGTGDAKHFTLSKNGYLTTNETNEQRYLGIYNQADWRCYTSEGGNIAGQTFKFFRLVDPTLPRLTVSDVNLVYNAESGSVDYTLTNPVTGGVLTATSSEAWLTIGEQTSSTIALSCSENPTAKSRTATVTLTYSYDTDKSITKTVTVTQAANPNVVMTISEVRAQGTGDVETKGIVTSCSGSNAFIQDNEAAICIYDSNSIAVSIGDEVKVSGTLSTYKGLLEITSPEITVLSQGNSITPEVMTIAQVLSSTKEGWLVKIENATVTAIDEKNTTVEQNGSNIGVYDVPSEIAYAVNDKLTFTGNIGNYDGKCISNPSNVIVTVNVEPAINLSTTPIHVESQGASGIIQVTYDNITEVAAEVILCDVNGEATTYDWITADINNDNNVSYKISSNTNTLSRTCYLKVYAIDDEFNDVYSEVVSITQEGYVPDYATLPFVWNGGTKEDLLALYGVTENGLGSNYAESNAPYRVKLDTDDDYIQVKTDSQPGKVTICVKMLGGKSSSKITVQESADGETFSNVESLSISGNQNAVLTLETTEVFASSSRYVRLLFTKGSNVGVGAITIVGCSPLSVSAAGYATFSSTSALDFTNVKNIYAYTATVSGDAISFTRVNKVPSNTGLLLRSVNENGDAVSTRVPLYYGATYDVTDNAFVAATEEIDHLPTTDGGFTNYILNKPSDGIIGFYKANGQKVGAGKAYLHVSSELATRAYIAFSFDDPETGVAQIETLPQQGVAYDLQGRRINAPKGGLYIINGKKVIVK